MGSRKHSRWCLANSQNEKKININKPSTDKGDKVCQLKPTRCDHAEIWMRNYGYKTELEMHHCKPIGPLGKSDRQNKNKGFEDTPREKLNMAKGGVEWRRMSPEQDPLVDVSATASPPHSPHSPHRPLSPPCTDPPEDRESALGGYERVVASKHLIRSSKGYQVPVTYSLLIPFHAHCKMLLRVV